MTEYWSQDPSEYLGYGFDVAFAFTFNADGTYTEYFTGSTVTGGVKTYTQSVTKGTVEVDTQNKTIKTHPSESRYKIKKNKKTEQLLKKQIRPKNKLKGSTYAYDTRVEQSGTKDYI